jgi:hypothetical protein
MAPPPSRGHPKQSAKEIDMTRRSTFSTCAHCGQPFPKVEGRIQQWRVGNRFACNEFCAEGVEDQGRRPDAP